MTGRRSRGDGGLSWDEARQCWVAAVTVGYTPAGRRIVRRARGRTKTDARTKLKEIVRDYDDGLILAGRSPTVADTVNDWLDHGLGGRDPATVKTLRILARHHVIPPLGGRKLHELAAEDVDQWLAAEARTLSTGTLARIKSILARSIAQARDKVQRNVVLLCETPTGQAGRPSKSLALEQAQALLDAATGSTVGAYITVSLLTGARTEELRALTWSHVDLDGKPGADVPSCPHMRVWRSVRAGGGTKTRSSRRTLALPHRAIIALREQHDRCSQTRRAEMGRPRSRVRVRKRHRLESANVRRDMGTIAAAAGLDADAWTPRELRHTFVSLLSDEGVPIEQIARLVGHSGVSKVTESVYRKQLRPVIDEGATAMNRVVPVVRGGSYSPRPQTTETARS